MGNVPGKVSIIGAGFVGSSLAFTLMTSGLVSELVIVDVNSDKALGEVMDLSHGMSFIRPLKISAGDYMNISGSEVVVITAGVSQKSGETRLDLVKKNTEIFKSIVPQIVKYSPESIILVVTNPVDVLTYVTYKLSGLPKNKVIGSGTVLDTSRFKYLLSEHVGVDSRNIHAYILGEHGDSEVPIWSSTTIAGLDMDDFCIQCKKCGGQSKDEIFLNVKNSAYEIIKRKGATYYAVALAVRRIVECILRNENSILTVSSLVTGQYGISEICISLPTIVNSSGICQIFETQLSESEMIQLKDSAEVLKGIITELNI